MKNMNKKANRMIKSIDRAVRPFSEGGSTKYQILKPLVAVSGGAVIGRALGGVTGGHIGKGVGLATWWADYARHAIKARKLQQKWVAGGKLSKKEVDFVNGAVQRGEAPVLGLPDTLTRYKNKLTAPKSVGVAGGAVGGAAAAQYTMDKKASRVIKAIDKVVRPFGEMGSTRTIAVKPVTAVLGGAAAGGAIGGLTSMPLGQLAGTAAWGTNYTRNFIKARKLQQKWVAGGKLSKKEVDFVNGAVQRGEAPVLRLQDTVTRYKNKLITPLSVGVAGGAVGGAAVSQLPNNANEKIAQFNNSELLSFPNEKVAEAFFNELETLSSDLEKQAGIGTAASRVWQGFLSGSSLGLQRAINARSLIGRAGKLAKSGKNTGKTVRESEMIAAIAPKVSKSGKIKTYPISRFATALATPTAGSASVAARIATDPVRAAATTAALKGAYGAAGPALFATGGVYPAAWAGAGAGIVNRASLAKAYASRARAVAGGAKKGILPSDKYVLKEVAKMDRYKAVAPTHLPTNG